MEFHDAANFLLELRRYPPRPGLDATRDLLAFLDDPQEDIAFVQVAGSNGKGSTARMTESVLREAGLDVGLYTSPHMNDVRERVRVDGRMITESALTEYAETIRPYVLERAADGDCPTFFETLTGLAFWEFHRQNVDVAVCEVGIGGRYDATSVISPTASAVTSVALEHTDVLGDTVAEIGRDMATVAPSENALVTATTGDARSAIAEQAGDIVTVGTTDDANISVEYGGRTGVESTVELSGPDWSVETRLPLLGAHQADNAGVVTVLARQVTDGLGIDLTEGAIERGLRAAHWPGRFEVQERNPLVVLDGAHNPGACERLAEVLDEFDYDDLHLVFGALVDKDHRGMADALPTPDHVVACQPDVPRAEDRNVLASVFDDTERVETHSDVTDALATARRVASSDDCVLICGSLYTVREARTHWSRLDIPKEVETLSDARRTLKNTHVTDAGTYRMRGKAVHRALKTRVRPRQAQYLKEELLSLGGECGISGLNDQNEEFLDVLMMGTLSQFKRLTEKLEAQPYGLGPLAAGIRETLSIGVEPEKRGYPWEERTAVMGILNVTPDSFHDGGEFDSTKTAVRRAEEMIEEGADIIDVGGESTRPGADPISPTDECERVVPVIERIADLDCLLSIDTRKADVARAALDAGVDILNDVSGLEDPEMRFVAAEYDCPLIVMHSITTPVDPDSSPEYDDVVEDTVRELRELVLLAEKAGLDREKIIADPGIGFGKSRRENFEILGRMGEFRALDCPILCGHSHKSMFDLVGSDAGERLPATVAGSAVAAERGADIVRVHDVKESVTAVRVSEAANTPDEFGEN